jgi:amino acid transporter
LPIAELSATRAPLALIYERATGNAPLLISAISLFAVVNGALIQIVMASRVIYGMSNEGWQIAVFAQVSPLTRTPVVATVLVTFIVLVLALWLPIVTLAKITSLVILVVFSLVNLSLVLIKRREPAPPGMHELPSWVPRVAFLCTAVFVLYQIAVLLGT